VFWGISRALFRVCFVRKNAEVGEFSFLASIAKGGWAKRRRPKQAPGRESHPRSGSEGPGSRQTNQGRESERSRVERLHIGAVPHNHIRFGSSLSPRAITVIEHGGLVRGGARCAAGTSRLPLQPLQCAPVRAQETLVRPLAEAWRSASPFLRTSPFKLHQRRPILG